MHENLGRLRQKLMFYPPIGAFCRMELLDIVCENTGVLLGQQVPRNVVIEQSLWCRSTNVFVINQHGEMLVHQRSLEKERHPGVWSTHLGGHVGAGETFETNALKELEEESGITVSMDKILPWRTSKIEKARLWVQDFVTLVDKDAVTPVPQPGEVQQFAWMSAADILAAAKENPSMWLAGTHDFHTEYACLRAVTAAAQRIGVFSSSSDLVAWHPLSRV